MPPKTLSDWLQFIEANHSQEIDLGLERVNSVAQSLGLVDLAVPVITVGGTNGKGSTIAYMASILGAAGFRVASYTSPHFVHYNERVLINGQMSSDESLCQAFAEIYQCASAMGVSLTYFEYGTLAALSIFKRLVAAQQLDVILLEVGLGGRLDAVNIVDSQVAVVTTVALDHQSWLGADREQIGFEKAGIYRQGLPAVYGEINMPQSVEARIEVLGSRRYQVGREFSADLNDDGSWNWQGLDSQGCVQRLEQLPMPQLPFQNAATAIQALWLLNLPVSAEAYRLGIGQASLTGRFQRLQYQGKDVILDVAHNPHAAAHLAQRLEQEQYQSVHCVLGMLADKDVAETLQPLKSIVSHWYLGTLHEPRGLKASDLLVKTDLTAVSTFDTVVAAFDQAVADSNSVAVIVVMGSFYTVAEILANRLETQVE